jgi:hypothetical protein
VKLTEHVLIEHVTKGLCPAFSATWVDSGFTTTPRKTVNDRRTSCRIVKRFRADAHHQLCLTRQCSPTQNSARENRETGKMKMMTQFRSPLTASEE